MLDAESEEDLDALDALAEAAAGSASDDENASAQIGNTVLPLRPRFRPKVMARQTYSRDGLRSGHRPVMRPRWKRSGSVLKALVATKAPSGPVTEVLQTAAKPAHSRAMTTLPV
jgi:hypothetical protein